VSIAFSVSSPSAAASLYSAFSASADTLSPARPWRRLGPQFASAQCISKKRDALNQRKTKTSIQMHKLDCKLSKKPHHTTPAILLTRVGRETRDFLLRLEQRSRHGKVSHYLALLGEDAQGGVGELLGLAPGRWVLLAVRPHDVPYL